MVCARYRTRLGRFIVMIARFLACLYGHSPQLSQLATGDEVLLGVAFKRHVLTAIGRVSELGELANDVLALRFLSNLQWQSQLGRRQQRTVGGIVDGQFHPLSCHLERHVHRYLALSGATCHEPFEGYVVVAIESHAWTQSFRHAQRVQSVAFSPVHAEADERMVLEKAQPAVPATVNESRRNSFTLPTNSPRAFGVSNETMSA